MCRPADASVSSAGQLGARVARGLVRRLRGGTASLIRWPARTSVSERKMQHITLTVIDVGGTEPASEPVFD